MKALALVFLCGIVLLLAQIASDLDRIAHDADTLTQRNYIDCHDASPGLVLRCELVPVATQRS